MTAEQEKILGMVVLNPAEWMANAVKVLGKEKADEALIAKVEAYKPLYTQSLADGQYKTAAQVKAEIQSSPEVLEQKARMEAEFAKKREAEATIRLNLPSTQTVFERLDLLTKDIETAKSIAALSVIITDLTKKVRELTEVVCILAKVE
jgi:hypothetical protein